MDLNSIFATLRKNNTPVPKPMRLPKVEEIENIEKLLGYKLHPDFYEYLLKASDVVYGTLEPAQITIPNSHDYLLNIINDATEYGLPEGYLPICEDNGAFYCMDKDGKVHFWGVDYNGFTGENWDNIGIWIMEIWLGKNA